MSDLEFSDSETEEDLCNNNVLKLLFNKAADHVQNIHDRITQDNLLQLYAYYKQATIGKCNTKKPGLFQVQARSKWNSWHGLGDMPKSEAMDKYVKLLEQQDPIWHSEVTNEIELQQKDKTKTPQAGWVVHSTLQQTNYTIEENDKTPFDYVREGDLVALKKFLATQHTDLINLLTQHKDDNGMGLVHWATDRNQPQILEYLLQSGADVNLRDDDDQTPLHYAASCGHLDCINILLKNGADALLCDSANNTCIDVAEDPEISKILLKRKKLTISLKNVIDMQ